MLKKNKGKLLASSAEAMFREDLSTLLFART